jgi:hypothetical protein
MSHYDIVHCDGLPLLNLSLPPPPLIEECFNHHHDRLSLAGQSFSSISTPSWKAASIGIRGQFVAVSLSVSTRLQFRLVSGSTFNYKPRYAKFCNHYAHRLIAYSYRFITAVGHVTHSITTGWGARVTRYIASHNRCKRLDKILSSAMDKCEYWWSRYLLSIYSEFRMSGNWPRMYHAQNGGNLIL